MFSLGVKKFWVSFPINTTAIIVVPMGKIYGNLKGNDQGKAENWIINSIKLIGFSGHILLHIDAWLLDFQDDTMIGFMIIAGTVAEDDNYTFHTKIKLYLII